MDKMTVKELDQKLNPEDIQSIHILKNESAISKYGDKGKEGVIEITAKNYERDSTLTEALNKIVRNEIINGEKLNKISPDDNKVFVKVEVEPSFPGGAKAWESFLMKNLNPNAAKEKGAKTGFYKVIIRFIVDKNGNVSDIKALSKNGYGMEEDAVRVISNSPKWIPAMQNGKVVTAYKTQPVFFAINPEQVKSKLIAPNTK